MISSHAARMGPLLRPALLVLAQAIEATQPPGRGDADGAALDVQGLCDRVNQAQAAFARAFGRLQPEVIDRSSCDAATLNAVAEACRVACVELADADVLVRSHARSVGWTHEAETLAQASRDGMALAAHLAADLVRALCDSDALLAMADSSADGGDDGASAAFGVRLTMPDGPSELAGWMPMRVAYRHGDVQMALRVSARKPTPLQQFQARSDVAPEPARGESGPGFWSILGWVAILPVVAGARALGPRP
jgi:hypothetical protein